VIALVTLVMLGSPAGVVVTVLDPAGTPLPEVIVACERGAAGTALSDEHGRAALPAGCRRVSCERGDLVAGRAAVRDGIAVCRLESAAVLRGTVVLPDDGRPYSVAAVERGSPRRAAGGQFERPEGSAPRRFRLPALRPGRYDLWIVRGEDWWSCVSLTPELPPVDHAVTAVWREPGELRGTVLDGSGAPMGRALLHVRYALDAAAGGGACQTDPRGPDLVSGADGRFVALVDLARRPQIVPDEAWGEAMVVLDAVERQEERR
jgi:hypothetical protein